MSLQEKLKQKESGLPSVTQKMKEIEKQNELLLFRMKEITDIIKVTIETSQTINENHENELDKKITEWNYELDQLIKQHDKALHERLELVNNKINRIKDSNQSLTDGFDKAIRLQIDDNMHQIKESTRLYIEDLKTERNEMLIDFSRKLNEMIKRLDHTLQQSTQVFDEHLKSVGESIKEVSDVSMTLVKEQQKQMKTINNFQFYVTNIMFVAVALILVRALFFGIWEGLYIKNLYEWGSQWEWLQYTMIGIFVTGLCILGIHVYHFLKDFNSRR